jgi:mono/diheme cytochrome c family protein
MSMREALFAAAIFACSPCALRAESTLGGPIRAPALGATATPDQITSYDIDVSPDGKGLPPGSGAATQGEAIYAQKCQACHGPEGVHGQALTLVGGFGTIGKRDIKPLRTIGSYWPYATSVFAYVRRAMPYYDTKTLTNDELYSVTAYLLYLNKIIGHDDVMNQATLSAVKMPWRGHFRPFIRGD